jgi:hypothetical protein
MHTLPHTTTDHPVSIGRLPPPSQCLTNSLYFSLSRSLSLVLCLEKTCERILRTSKPMEGILAKMREGAAFRRYHKNSKKRDYRENSVVALSENGHALRIKGRTQVWAESQSARDTVRQRLVEQSIYQRLLPRHNVGARCLLFTTEFVRSSILMLAVCLCWWSPSQSLPLCEVYELRMGQKSQAFERRPPHPRDPHEAEVLCFSLHYKYALHTR